MLPLRPKLLQAFPILLHSGDLLSTAGHPSPALDSTKAKKAALEDSAISVHLRMLCPEADSHFG
jgi:hypothetical protein